jgi:hypothetical protein
VSQKPFINPPSNIKGVRVFQQKTNLNMDFKLVLNRLSVERQIEEHFVTPEPRLSLLTVCCSRLSLLTAV